MSDARVTSQALPARLGVRGPKHVNQGWHKRCARVLLDSQIWFFDSVLTHPWAFSVRLRAHVGPVVPQPAASGV